VELPQQPPPLTPHAALALFQALHNARVTPHGQATDPPGAHHLNQPATNQQRKG
jgi:hypothetical protein